MAQDDDVCGYLDRVVHKGEAKHHPRILGCGSVRDYSDDARDDGLIFLNMKNSVKFVMDVFIAAVFPVSTLFSCSLGNESSTMFSLVDLLYSL